MEDSLKSPVLSSDCFTSQLYATSSLKLSCLPTSGVLFPFSPAGIQYCKHKWLWWNIVYDYLWNLKRKKITWRLTMCSSAFTSKPMQQADKICAWSDFPQGTVLESWTQEKTPQENPKVCVCSSPTCHAWKLFLVECVIYIRSSHHSSPLIVPYVYAKPHWWGVWDYISVNYNVLSDPLDSQGRFGEG